MQESLGKKKQTKLKNIGNHNWKDSRKDEGVRMDCFYVICGTELIGTVY